VKSIPLSLAIATALLGVLATVSVCALLIRLLLVRVGRPLLMLLRLCVYGVARAALLTGILAIAAGWQLPRRGSSARRVDPEALLRLCRIRTRTLRRRFLGVTQQLTHAPQAAWTAVKSRPPTPSAASGLDARLLSGGLAVALIPALLGTLVGLLVAQEVRRELPEMMQAAEQAEKPVSITRAPVAAGRPPTRLCTAKPRGAGRSMPPAMVSEHGWLAALGAPLPSFLLDWLVADYTHALALKLRGIEGEVTGVARLGATASHTFLYCLPFGPAIVVPTDAVEAIAGTAALAAAFRWPRSDWEEPPATALDDRS